MNVPGFAISKYITYAKYADDFITGKARRQSRYSNRSSFEVMMEHFGSTGSGWVADGWVSLKLKSCKCLEKC